MKNVKRNVKAISPVLAVLMMIAVAIAGSLITYAWVMGYIGFTTEKSGQAIMIQSIATNATGSNTLDVYVQNVGEGAVELTDGACLYVNGELMTTSTGGGVYLEKETATLTVPSYTVETGQKITVKVTTALGAFTEKSDYPASTTG